ncbi:hypothetical protein ACFLQT_01185 [Bacteroidota bacterium]
MIAFIVQSTDKINPSLLQTITPYVAFAALILSMFLSGLKIFDQLKRKKDFKITLSIINRDTKEGMCPQLTIFVKCFSRDPIIVAYTQIKYDKDKKIIFDLAKNISMEYGKEISHYTLDHSITPNINLVEVIDFTGKRYSASKREIKKIKKAYKNLLQ